MLNRVASSVYTEFMAKVTSLTFTFFQQLFIQNFRIYPCINHTFSSIQVNLTNFRKRLLFRLSALRFLCDKYLCAMLFSSNIAIIKQYPLIYKQKNILNGGAWNVGEYGPRIQNAADCIFYLSSTAKRII